MMPERYARIKELFTAAAELTGSKRDAFLTRECVGDNELRQEVEALLKHDDPRTIIAAKDVTLADVAPRAGAQPPRTSVRQRLHGLRNLTVHLGPRGHLAIGALCSCLILAVLGYLGNHRIADFQQELRREALNEIVEGKVTALRMWIDHEKSKIASWSHSPALRGHINQLVELAARSDAYGDELRESPIQQAVSSELRLFADKPVQYSIWDRRFSIIADTCMEPDRIGESATPWGAGILASAFEGRSHELPFDGRQWMTRSDSALLREPHLGVVSPIFSDNGDVTAALLIHDSDGRQSPSQILSMVRLGELGETYVFNKDGLMLTESRFEAQLGEIGLIPDSPDSTSARSMYLRDPGGDLTQGYLPEEALTSRPLTRMARKCIAGENGDDLEGYRDYRGVKVVGAWRWLDDLDVGVATELDFQEAEPGLRTLTWESSIVLGLIAACMGIALFSYNSLHRMRQHLGENRKLGNYVLEQQIGEGGMGKVFRARHELLKQATAVKLLKPEFFDRESTARFEREAMLVSQLEHPNTIRVYDYGVTSDGLFYFVMEYINGQSLRELVRSDGAISPARTVFLLQQMCLSLREAHNAGLVHRDLKPDNIMVCRRAGDFDVIKVLDFGLVKPVKEATDMKITSANLVAGTPQYMAPERLSDPQRNDPRSDIYAIGAVAYFLLTGNDFLRGSNIADILLQVVNAPPLRPSANTSVSIPLELDELVYCCLAKSPDARPASVLDVIAVLERVQSSHPWTREDAAACWESK